MGMLLRLLTLFASLIFAGCATHVGQTHMMVLGFGVITAQGPTNVSASKVDSTVVGVGIQDGATIGAKKSSVILVDTNANVIIDSSSKYTTIRTY